MMQAIQVMYDLLWTLIKVLKGPMWSKMLGLHMERKFQNLYKIACIFNVYRDLKGADFNEFWIVF